MAFVNFWVEPTAGDNRNSGSTFNLVNNTATAAFYSSVSGNWNQSTRTFTPTDGSNPFASGVRVGDYVSIFLNAASETGCVSTVTAVTNAVNGPITVTPSCAGVLPGNSTGGMSLRDGGTWKGPLSGSSFPFGLARLGNLLPSPPGISNFTTRILFLNKEYPVSTSTITLGNPQPVPVVFATYYVSAFTNPRAIFKAQGTLGQIFLINFNSALGYFDSLSFQGSLTATGTSDLVSDGSTALWFNCEFMHARGNGLSSSNLSAVIECVAYDCNRGNSVKKGGFASAPSSIITWIRCVSHSHTGSNSCGFFGGSGAETLESCIATKCGLHGLGFNNSTLTPSHLRVKFCDFYNNGGAGIFLFTDVQTTKQNVLFENNNFVKNAGGAVKIPNTTLTGQWPQGQMNCCGYGTGAMANGAADTLGNITQRECFNYPANTTPWHDPDNGDFRLEAYHAIGWGDGDIHIFGVGGVIPPGFKEQFGYPDIGALQADPIGSPSPLPAPPPAGPSAGKGQKVQLRARDVAALTNRTQKAIHAIEHLRIVGESVAGDAQKGFTLND